TLLKAAEQKIKKALGRRRARHCDCGGDRAAEHRQAPSGVTPVPRSAISLDDHADVDPRLLNACQYVTEHYPELGRLPGKLQWSQCGNRLPPRWDSSIAPSGTNLG